MTIFTTVVCISEPTSDHIRFYFSGIIHVAKKNGFLELNQIKKQIKGFVLQVIQMIISNKQKIKRNLINTDQEID